MIHVFTTLKNLWKSKQLHIDHWVFRLHYRFTVLFLLIFCIIVSTKQYAGEPIKCSKDTREHSSLVETYCFVTSTYTVKTAVNLTPADGAPHPGVYPSNDVAQHRYHRYYQWVGFLLFIQSVFFYLPHWLWKGLEGGHLARLLDRDTRFLGDEERTRAMDLTLKHVRARWTKDSLFVVKYLACELLCLVNLFGQMELLDSVFENEFYGFGTEVARFWRTREGDDPLSRMFPKVASCTYRYFGGTGLISTESVLCVLAVNAINEKIFLFLWFWFVFLMAITIFALVVKTIIFSVPSLRVRTILMRFPNIGMEDSKTIVETGNLSNYLLVYLLGDNMDPIDFAEFIDQFVRIQKGKIN